MTNKAAIEFGKVFRKWRLKNKLKQSNLSKYFQVKKHSSYWTHLEHGNVGCPSTLLSKIYEKTGISRKYSPRPSKVSIESSTPEFHMGPSEFCKVLNSWRRKNGYRQHDLPKVISSKWKKEMYTHLCLDHVPIREDVLVRFYEVIPELKGLVPKYGVKKFYKRKTFEIVHDDMYKDGDSREVYLREQSSARSARLQHLKIEDAERRERHAKAFLGGIDG